MDVSVVTRDGIRQMSSLSPKNNGRATGLINLASHTAIRYSDGVARGSQDTENFLYVGQLLDGINLDEYNTVIVIEDNVRPL